MGKFSDLGKKYGHPQKSKFEEAKTPLDAISSTNAKQKLEDSIIEPIENMTNDIVKPMSWVNISKIVYEKDLFTVDIMSILYSAVHDTCQTIALLIRKEKYGKVQLFLGVRDKLTNQNFVSKYILQKALKGLLPGVAFEDVQISVDNEAEKSYLSSVSGVPALKNEKKEKFAQGIERLINAAVDIPSFDILLVAESLSEKLLDEKIAALETQYSELSVLSELTSTKSENTTSSKSETTTTGKNASTSDNLTSSTNESCTQTKSNTETKGESVGFIAGKNGSESSTDGESSTKGSSQSNGQTKTLGTSSSSAINNGENSTIGTSQQVKHEDKSIKNQLRILDKDISRLLSSKSSGLWNFSAFFFSENKLSSQALASLYKGLIIGPDTLNKSIDIHSYNLDCSKKFYPVVSAVKIPSSQTTALLNSDELAICMNFPQSSVPGILVCEQVAFGRNIHYKDSIPLETITLGNLYHLGSDDTQNKLDLDSNLLTSHMFISGTTGSGKSNALYLLLSELISKGKTFMVIEPAKGEYKNIFGHLNNVSVYGVIPGHNNVLKLNPFSFPKGIHIEEHIDRLIDIFNACWPMYAAMPSVLKAAVSNAYKSCGWNLISSTSEFDIFPTIEDVIRELSSYINTSEYSSDSKGDYKGALQTRLEGLTYGIIGNIFNNGDVPPSTLFDANVIVDLSRVGSSETKALIMGLLVVKLTEYRISSNNEINQNLQHVTVIEEAHNLLKATSTAQSQESSNITGKSVEMIASAIAEMRTYGEAFIIADQSPALLDRSVIRNTNTKVVFTLPDYEDRKIAATSFCLNDAQISELSKLPTGIAAVFQKGWEVPILAHFFKFDKDKCKDVEPAIFEMEEKYDNATNGNEMLTNILYVGLSGCGRVYRSELDRAIRMSNISGMAKIALLRYISMEKLTVDLFTKMMVDFVGIGPFIEASKEKEIKMFEYIIQNAIKVKVSNNIHLETLVNAYIKGCSNMNCFPFYDAWLINKSK